MKAISLYSAFVEGDGNRKTPDLVRYGLVEGGIEGGRLRKMGRSFRTAFIRAVLLGWWSGA